MTGRNFGRMKMCHMVADTTHELLYMVDKIGVQRKWIQYPGTYNEHFDIALGKRKLAIQFGAKEITAREYAQFCNNRKTMAESKKIRKLDDRTEQYDDLISGYCSCGENIVKVIGTDVDLRKDKTRFHYPDDNSPCNIFRCRNCNTVIDECFTVIKPISLQKNLFD
jgi:hypothetical protein